MLSITAYDLLNVIVEGEVTVHTLRAALIAREFSDAGANEVLLNCLIELCECGAVVCRVENDYGSNALAPASCESAVELVAAWGRVFGIDGPRGADVTSGTISVETTDLGSTLALDSQYDIYLPYLRELFDWPD